MKIHLTILLLIIFAQAALRTQQFVSEQAGGQWTTIFEAKPEHAHIPAQYYLCGYEFLENKWAKQLPICHCGWRFHRWRWGWRCNQCWNDFFNQASGFTAIFCNYNNWSQQITKVFTTASPNSRNWRGRVMCPIHTYATAFTGKYGVQHGEHLGFHGLLLACSNTEMKDTQNVQDNQNHPGHHYTSKHGNYISSFKLKYEPYGKLTGFAAYSEAMIIISNISIQYDLSTGFQNYPITLGTEKVQNCGKATVSKKVGISRIYETVGAWNSQNPETKGYAIMRSITIQPPRLMNTQTNINTPYQSTTGQFGFESPIKTTITSNQQILVTVAPKSETRISTVMQEQKGSIPYTAVLTFKNRVTGQFIMIYKIKGTWQGVTTSSVQTKVLQVSANCEKVNTTENEDEGNNQNNDDQRKNLR